jgi:phosphate transport system substrate-binding protein
VIAFRYTRWAAMFLLLSATFNAGAVDKATAAAAKPTAAAAASAKAKKVAPPPVIALPSIIWRGDLATSRAVVADLAKEFEKQKKGRIEMQPFSTISGIDAVSSGAADIAGTARPAWEKRSEETGMTFYPIAWDAVVVITSPKNPVGNLSLKQLHDIYYAKISNWKELGGADAPINVDAVAGPLDGVEFAFRYLIFRNGDQRVAAPRLYVNTAKLEEDIALNEFGMGLTTLSAVYANKSVKILSVEGIAPSRDSIANGTYPLYTKLFLAAREDGRNNAKVQEFVQFAAGPEALSIMRKHQVVGYAEAPDLLTKNEEHFAYIDAQIGIDHTADSSGAMIITTSTGSRPVSAVNATASAMQSSSPNSPLTQEVKDSAAAKTQAAKDAEKSVNDSKH